MRNRRDPPSTEALASENDKMCDELTRAYCRTNFANE